MLTDRTPEWTQIGRVPGWQVAVGEGQWPTITLDGDEAGAFRGYVLVGRAWTIPSPVPASLAACLEYQSFCGMDSEQAPRSGNAGLFLFTPERWRQFASAPADGEMWRPEADPGVVASVAIHGGPQDLTQWRSFRSSDLAPALRGHAAEEVVLALVWWCHHFCPEWAQFRGLRLEARSHDDLDWEFLRSFDLDRPDLTALKAAVDIGDLPGAKMALARHMATRQAPVCPSPGPDGSPRGLAAADEVCEKTFRFVGCPPYKFAGDIVWNADPYGYDQWAIALNRHTHWVTLGRAYAATGDERYAREFVEQLNGWLDAVPVRVGTTWVQGPFFEAGRSALSLDAGLRMGQTWWPTYQFFRGSPQFDAESQFRMVRSCAEHAAYLLDARAWHPTSNWGAMEACGLCHIAVMLPELREAPRWLQTAKSRLTEALEAQVYPDGAQIELSPGYHGVTLSNFLSTLELARANTVEMPPDLLGGLERMYEYYLTIAIPDGRYPALNDSGAGGVAGVLTQGRRLFPHRADWAYLATDRKEGTPPEWTSRALPCAGWYVMRSGWEAADGYLHFQAGPFGAGHRHEDKLSVIVHAAGKTVLTDAGNYSYDRSKWRQFPLSSRAHNVVLVDGLDQCSRRDRQSYVNWEPTASRWLTNADFDYAEGSYDGGFGAEAAVKVEHRRQVVFVKPDHWIVVDTLLPADGGEHSYEALFNIDAENVTTEGGGGVVTAEHESGRFSVAAAAVCPLSVRLVRGQESPVVLGWLPTGRHNELRPIPTAVYRWRGSGPTAVAYVLQACRPEGTTCVESIEAIEGQPEGVWAWDLHRADGGAEHVFRRLPETTGQAAGSVSTDAELAVVCADPGAVVLRTVAVGGTAVATRK